MGCRTVGITFPDAPKAPKAPRKGSKEADGETGRPEEGGGECGRPTSSTQGSTEEG